MENTHTSASLAPIATPEQRQALIRNQHQRLRDQAEALLRAVEAIEPPKTYPEAERAAKALLAVSKVLEAAHKEHPYDKFAPAGLPEPQMEHEHLTTWKAILDSSLETLAQARQLKRDEEAEGAG